MRACDCIACGSAVECKLMQRPYQGVFLVLSCSLTCRLRCFVSRSCQIHAYLRVSFRRQRRTQQTLQAYERKAALSIDAQESLAAWAQHMYKRQEIEAQALAHMQ